jgi:uncharacterized Zn ribbon protein
MKQSRFFAVKSNSARKLRNFIRLVKRMGINYNHDWTSIELLDEYPRNHSDYALGFSNHWSVQSNNSYTCAMTPSDKELIDIDTRDGYIDAVKRVMQEIEYIGTQIFSDINGTELKVGDRVVMIDNDDLLAEDEGDVTVFKIGEVLIVEQLKELDPNYIIFVSASTGLMNGFYGHRVAKLIK